MIVVNPTVETERKEAGFPRVLDGVYLTRFDTYETENELVFRSLMPDVRLVQVEAGIKNGELVIQGKVRFAPDTVLSQSVLKPLSFFRSFPMLQAVVADRISANFKKGRLTVHVPKAGVVGH